jgi:N-acetylmuramoyl-L-alanine amidase
MKTSLALGLGFFLSVLSPSRVFCASEAASRRVKDGPLVVLDAGHGGEEAGATAGVFTEAAFTLDLAKRVAKLLTADGIQAVLTRDDARGASITARACLANRVGASCFISLHANFSFTPASKGPRVFVSSARNAGTLLQDPHGGKALVLSRWSQSQAAVAEDSRALGGAIAGALGGGTGVQALRLAQFKGLLMPAALVECGFSTQEKELERMKSLQGLDDLAERISRGARRFLANHSAAKP